MMLSSHLQSCVEVLEDVFMHYDRDESGDLGPEEVAQVLQVRNRLRDSVGERER